MDRRDFIKHTGVAVAAAVGTTATAATGAPLQMAQPHVHTGTRELRLAMPWTQNGRGGDDSARRLAQSIADLSQGRIRVTPLAGQHGLETLRDGAADLYHGSGHDFVALDPVFAYFAGLPGNDGLRPTFLNAWLMAAGGQGLWDDLGAMHGLKPLLAGHTGARSSLWSARPIATASELRGLRIAVAGLGAPVAERLGATAMTLATPDLAAALRDGRIDAVEGGGTISGYASDLHLAGRHCLRPGLTRNGTTMVLAVAAPLWAELSPADQIVIQAATALELNTATAETLAVSRRLREALAGHDPSVTFARADRDFAEATRHASAAVVAALARSSPVAARVNASYVAFRAGLPAPRRRAPTPPVA